MSVVPEKKWAVWTGRVLSALPALLMLLSGVMKLARVQPVLDGWQNKFGYPLSTLLPIGILEVACVIVYLIPRTAVLGAVLVSCYLAAAFSTHLRIGDPSGILPLLLGICAWGGLYLRDRRIRALLPIRQTQGD